MLFLLDHPRFADRPAFLPSVSPKVMLKMGIFGGHYFGAKAFCNRPPRCGECVLESVCDKRDIDVAKKDLKINQNNKTTL
jgi:hypothetical protein